MPAFTVRKTDQKGRPWTIALTAEELENAVKTWQSLENDIFELKYTVLSVFTDILWPYPNLRSLGIDDDMDAFRDIAAKIVVEEDLSDNDNAIQQALCSARVKKHLNNYIREKLKSLLPGLLQGRIPYPALEAIFAATNPAAFQDNIRMASGIWPAIPRNADFAVLTMAADTVCPIFLKNISTANLLAIAEILASTRVDKNGKAYPDKPCWHVSGGGQTKSFSTVLDALKSAQEENAVILQEDPGNKIPVIIASACPGEMDS